MTDVVNHPKHYGGVPGIECIEVVEHFPFCRGNAIKYLWRAGAKGDLIEDLRKAIWYIQREIDTVPAPCCEHTPEMHDQHGCTVDLSTDRRVYVRCHQIGDPAAADAPGTCHLVGCEGKGTVDEHRRASIGAADDFTAYQRGTCLGFPRTLGLPRDGLIQTVCSLNGPWASPAVESLSSYDMALLVDKHKADCIGPQR